MGGKKRGQSGQKPNRMEAKEKPKVTMAGIQRIVANEMSKNLKRFDSKFEQLARSQSDFMQNIKEMAEEMGRLAEKRKEQYISALRDENRELMKELRNYFDGLIGGKLEEANEKYYKAEAELSCIKAELSSTKAELAEKEKELDSKEANLQERHKSLCDATQNLKDVQSDFEALSKEFDTNKRDLSEEKAKLEKSQGELGAAYLKLEAKEKELSGEKAKGKAQAEELSRIKEELADTEAKLRAQMQKQDVTEKTLQEMESSLEEERETLGHVQQQLSNYSSRFGSWEDITKDYREIMDKMYRCPSLKGIVLKFALEEELGKADTVDNMVKFIGVIGTGSSFAQEVYNAIRLFKKTDLQYLTEEEKNFIAVLNRYYRKVLLVEFDVLDIPEAGRFEPSAMQDIDKPTAPYRNMEGVYVPGLREDQNTFKQKAIVQGVRG